VTELIDLYAAAQVVGTETALANRLDTGISGVTSTDTKKRKLVAVSGRCANTGILIARLDGDPRLTLDLATLNAATFPIPVEVEVPAGQTLTVKGLSSSGTAAIAVVLHVQKGG
jgi:hypothetical protein